METNLRVLINKLKLKAISLRRSKFELPFLELFFYENLKNICINYDTLLYRRQMHFLKIFSYTVYST
jgi:hypothetical protein